MLQHLILSGLMPDSLFNPGGKNILEADDLGRNHLNHSAMQSLGQK